MSVELGIEKKLTKLHEFGFFSIILTITVSQYDWEGLKLRNQREGK